ncbi:hypothetical protein DFH07DRAFT_462579 [Mycena maculata]|uniref:Uncharacterized protein n=1 Tax=Mycena maculata TaxID=230809 RepID=A0AAD7K7Y3_9AGAR|nr:hypothetical protein DFH07DRAFT_462579 [Mycena maculata]
MPTFKALLSVIIVAAILLVQGGPLAYGECQTGCNNLTVACYSRAGLVFGTVVAEPAAPAAALVCNKALSTCSSVCAKETLSAPTQ